MSRLVVAMVLLCSIVGASAPVVADEHHVEEIATFEELGEGITVGRYGEMYVTFPFTGEVRRLAPDGTEQVVAVLPHGAITEGRLGPLGVTVDPLGRVVVAVASFDDDRGVYQIDWSGQVSRLPGTEAVEFPNGVVHDRRGNLYVTDTAAGVIWRVPPGGTAERWLVDDALQGTGAFGFPWPIGANGVDFRFGHLYVANTEQGTILRVPVRPDGSPGPVRVAAEDPALVGVDGLAVDPLGSVWAVVLTQNTLVRVAPHGVSVVADAEDGLRGPSSIDLSHQGHPHAAYVLNFDILSPDPQPGIVRVPIGF